MTFVIVLLSTIIVPVVTGTLVFNRLPLFGKYIVLFFYANLLSDAVSLILGKLYGNNMIVYYFFASVAAILIGLIYGQIVHKKVLYVFSMVPAIALFEAFISGTNNFNSYSFTIFNILCLQVTLFTFYKMAIGELQSGIFLFNGILLFYAISSTVFFFTARYLQQADVQLMMKLFGIHSYINSVTNLAFALSVWTLLKSSLSVR
jgi:hypothetical protein